MQDESSKTPASCECASPKASEVSKTEGSGIDPDPIPPEILHKKYAPHNVPFGGRP